MKKIFLIGYMGCGKSSLGRKLAKVANMEFMDMDSIIEQREGASISDIFYYQGEEYFRNAERALIEELGTAEGDMVISTGGGSPAWKDNMECLNSLGTTIYLQRSPEQILSRLSAYGREKRPMFRGKSDEELLEFMRVHMAEREPYYNQAHIVIECDACSDDEAVEKIVDYINR